MAEHSSPSSSRVIHATLRALEEPVVLVDRFGIIDFANPAFHKQFRLSSADTSLSSFFLLEDTLFPISNSGSGRFSPLHVDDFSSRTNGFLFSDNPVS